MNQLSLLIVTFFIFSFSAFAQAPQQAPDSKASPSKTSPDIAKKPPLEASVNEGLSKRDPFKLPEYLIIKIRQKNSVIDLNKPGMIDESVEAIRRWPLPTYQLVGIIWDVNKPKAMFLDRNNNIHVLTMNDFIGNAKGIVTAIQSGSVTVLEGRIPQVIKLKK